MSNWGQDSFLKRKSWTTLWWRTSHRPLGSAKASLDVQEEALELTMLHEVETLVEQVRTLPKGTALEASCEAVRQHLHEQPYTEQASR